MKETHAQENDRLLEPYIATRNRIAHECLAAMLQNRHEDAGRLLADYQLAALAVTLGIQICGAFDDADPIEPD